MKDALAAAAVAAALLQPAAALAQDERVWRFYDGPDRITLVYGVPETDDVFTALSCAPGRRMRAATFVDREISGPETTSLVIASGKVSARLTAQASVDEMNGGAYIEALFATGGPVMREFSRTGVIRMTVYGQSTNMPAAPLRDVRRLMQACTR